MTNRDNEGAVEARPAEWLYQAEIGKRSTLAASGCKMAADYLRRICRPIPTGAEAIALMAMGAPQIRDGVATEAPVGGIDIGDKGRAAVRGALKPQAEPARRKKFIPSAATLERMTRYHAEQAERSQNLWRAVVWQIAADITPHWGVSATDRKESLFFFSEVSSARKWREEMSIMSGIAADKMVSAHKSGALNEIGADSIGKRRWETRHANAEASAAQPDLFRRLAL